ncbi:Metallo-hydrolase/oxidoreductase [Auricularia subglabra TFB-10046 SS5]|nr:Metallo-hydrolase/oxidoreductase [Auricularia subglabra TFB-10046 SS5]
MTPLPAPSPDQAFWTVSALEAGKVVLPERLFVTDADPAVTRKCPSLAFLLRHSASGQTLVFDLGIRKDISSHAPAIQERIRTVFEIEARQDAADSLRGGGLAPAAVDFVVLSHLHWDHVGDPAPFVHATFLVGAGGQALLDGGYPVDPRALFERDLLPRGRTQFLDVQTAGRPLGPFARALDYFQDGSLYVVDAPGHVAGHVNLLVRTRANGGWLYLGGDTCHDWRLLSGERHICVYEDGRSAHADREAAAEHIARVRTLRDEYGTAVIMAHEYRWDEEHQDEYYPNAIKV